MAGRPNEGIGQQEKEYKLVSFPMSPQTKKQLRFIAAYQDTSMKNLLQEAVNEYIQKNAPDVQLPE